MSANGLPRIGVFIPLFNNQIFADLLAGIESVAAAQGYQTLVVNYDYDSQREKSRLLPCWPLRSKVLLTESVHSLRAENT
jgi:DNA-binding LacI/PurR family transcriptional regulator